MLILGRIFCFPLFLSCLCELLSNQKKYVRGSQAWTVFSLHISVNFSLSGKTMSLSIPGLNRIRLMPLFFLLASDLNSRILFILKNSIIYCTDSVWYFLNIYERSPYIHTTDVLPWTAAREWAVYGLNNEFRLCSIYCFSILSLS